MRFLRMHDQEEILYANGAPYYTYSPTEIHSAVKNSPCSKETSDTPIDRLIQDSSFLYGPDTKEVHPNGETSEEALKSASNLGITLSKYEISMNDTKCYDSDPKGVDIWQYQQKDIKNEKTD